MKDSKALRKFVLASVLSALIVVMTLVPYTGYINYGLIEITTLHVVVALGAAFLGPGYGAMLGGVWGLTCWIRAFTNPMWVLFTNPLISLVPRILVGLVAGLIFKLCDKLFKERVRFISASVSGITASLVNTVLVLSAMVLFGGQNFNVFRQVWTVIVSLNGSLELVTAIVMVPVLYKALDKVASRF